MAFFGGWTFAAPASQVALVDGPIATATVQADVRAPYGGLTRQMGLFLSLCRTRRTWTAPGLLACLCTLTGFAPTRFLSAVIDGSVSATVYWLMGIEYWLMGIESAGAALAGARAALTWKNH